MKSIIEEIINNYFNDASTKSSPDIINFINNYNSKIVLNSSIVKPNNITISAVKLDENRIIAIYGSTNDNFLYCVIILTNENVVFPLYYETIINNNFNANNNVSIVKLNENEVFISYMNINSKLCGARCVINNDNSVTIKDTIVICDASNNNIVKPILIDKDKILLIYDQNETDIFGTVILNNNNKLISNGNTLIDIIQDKTSSVELEKLADNKILIAYAENKQINCLICNIKDSNTLSLKRFTLANNENISEKTKVLIKVFENKLFLIYNINSYLYAIIYNFENDNINQSTIETLIHTKIYKDFLINALDIDKNGIEIRIITKDNKEIYNVSFNLLKSVVTEHNVDFSQNKEQYEEFDEYADYGDVIGIIVNDKFINVLHKKTYEIELEKGGWK